MECRICNSATTLFYKGTYDFYQCTSCNSAQRHSNSFLTPDDERKRYELHINDVNDKGYQKFVSPIVEQVLQHHLPGENGLDFGSGTGPVITKLLRDCNYKIQTYDPFFDNNKTVLTEKYNYIVCCEVMEHFHDPLKEFALLKSLLHPNGKLYCMTELFEYDIDFASWYYKNDPTHVFFYTKKVLNYLRDKLGFSDVEVSKRLIVYTV